MSALGISMGLATGTQSGRWWPEGAVYAADFINNRYMRNQTLYRGQH